LDAEVRSGSFNGIGLHVITAEPGGDDEILARLAVRDIRSPSFKVHSDPNFKLLLKESGNPNQESSLFVKKLMKCSGFNSQTSLPYEDYTMVQPALVVIHRSGEVRQVWSWKTDLLKDFEPSEMTEVPGYGKMVAIRPISSDIPKSIKEKRNVKLQYQGLSDGSNSKSPGVSVSVMVGVAAVSVVLIHMFLKKRNSY
jgi:hypothetical protein